MKSLLSPKRRRAVGGNIAMVSAIPGAIVALGGFFILIGQIRGWLKTGDWTPHTVFELLHQYLGMEYPKPSWWAAQKLADFLLSFPASLCLFVLGYFLTIGAVLLIAYPLLWLGLMPPEESGAD